VVPAAAMADPEVMPCTALLVHATVNPVTAVPPLDAGATQETVASAWVEVVATEVGAPGTTSGVAEAVAEAVPVPTAFTAETRKAYALPFVRPVAVYEVDEDPVDAVRTVQVTPASVDRSTL